MSSGREYDLVELVSVTGEAIGVCTVAEAHTAPGSRHRAFSVLLFDPAGRMLLQQRAARKTRFPLRWANACCGHPAPGENVIDAGTRRLAEEIGLRSVALTEAGVYAYRAADPTTGRVEDEYDHVLVGRLLDDTVAAPDPAEVAALRWADQSELTELAEKRPINAEAEEAPWLSGVVRTAINSEVMRALR